MINYRKRGKDSMNDMNGVSIICAVSSGLFSSEYVVKINDKKMNLIWEGVVDRELVTGIRHDDVQSEKYIPGRVYAELIEKNPDGTFLVELPSEGWAKGRRIQVSRDLIMPERMPA